MDACFQCLPSDGVAPTTNRWRLELSTRARSRCFVPTQFADVVHFQNLFSSDWPAVTIGDSGAETGNNGAAWNYGQNFGGPLKAGWASGADTVHSGGVGMFGTMGVDAPNVWSRVMPNGEIICEFPASEEPPLMD
eukprot:1930923-Rhodomonas_salina.3